MEDLDEPLFWEIENYLHNRMDATQKEDFERRLKNDPWLQNTLALFREADKDLDAFFRPEGVGVSARKQELMERGRNLLNPKRQSGRHFLFWLSATAAAIATMVVAVYQFTDWFSKENRPSASAIYQQYFSTDEITGSGLLSADDANNRLGQVYRFMEARQYQQAADSLQSYLQDESFAQRPKALFLLGVAQLNLQQPSLAVGSFRQIPPSAGTLSQEGEWYTAAAYLQLQDFEGCRTVLHSIADNPKHRRQQQAAEVLNLVR